MTTTNPPAPAKYDDLKALFLNCTLKRSPGRSNTRGVIEITKHIYEENDVSTEVLRLVDYHIPAAMLKDVTEVAGVERDDWPEIQAKIDAADILVLCTPIWLGDKSSICTKAIERMYAYSSDLNAKGQWKYYDKVGAAIITGNEDGVKHCAMNMLYSLGHIGYTIPPQADAGWIGEIGPGPSYLDKDSGGPENNFTNRNASFLAWNTLHLARMLKDQGGYPAHGNRPKEWKAGCRPDYESPEHRV